MRFVHTSDPHIGKKLAGISLEGDIASMLSWLEGLIEREGASALVVSGDVFDVPVPPESAVRLWDDFVTRLARCGTQLLVIGGNHDSGTRLGFGSGLAELAGVHVAGEICPPSQRQDVPAGPDVPLPGKVVLLSERDGHEVVDRDDPDATCAFWLVPFLRPADVRAWARAAGVELPGPLSYDAAMRLVVQGDADLGLVGLRGRPEHAAASHNVLVAHQFVTAGGAEPERSDSERMSLGTLDNVDVSAFEGFDYVALGHIHRPQRVGSDLVRYAGSPLKYSVSEVDCAKSVVVVDVEEGTEPRVRLVPVEAPHDLRVERGSFADLVERGTAEPDDVRSDYVAACLVDDDEPLDVAQRLRAVWPNLVGVRFDNARTAAEGIDAGATVEVEASDLPELFSAFFKAQTGCELTGEELSMVTSALENAQKRSAS